ncbi:GerAB/ArcD/ProY family transporter [Desulfotomaculum copahuensis]|uniref:Uncharacterized protein n=1 Tax=Desulfotomaculum copahuensis TaxID=1838280 RepID=A0A1B7LDZ7_9FIRM|nr:endospore germination permease [Desulfotomaculum copahuensis]OAT81275.1 hypothetical protein A6M21_00315 [Desulfotomaculum copahuensis]
MDKNAGDDAYRLEKGRINSRQLAFLIITTVISTADIYQPALVARAAGRDAWIAVIMATAAGIGIWFLCAALARRFPRETVIQYSRRVLGPWAGGAAGLAFIIFFFFTSASTTRMLSDIMNSAYMPATPLAVFSLSLLVVGAYTVLAGVEVLGRVNELLLPLGMATLLFVGAASLPGADFNRFLPVLENGPGPVGWAAVMLAGYLGEAVIILMLFPYIVDQEKTTAAGARAVAAVGAALQVGVLAIALFGPGVTADLTFPALEMVRRIKLGDLITNLDILMMMVWVGGVYLKLSTIYYVTVLGLAQWLGLRDYRPLVAPLGVCMAAFSVFAYHGIDDYTAMLTDVFPGYTFVYELVLPLLLLLAAAWRGLGKKESN